MDKQKFTIEIKTAEQTIESGEYLSRTAAMQALLKLQVKFAAKIKEKN